MFRVFRDYIYGFLGLIASMITILLFAKLLYPSLSLDGQYAVLIMGSLFIWVYAENNYLKVRWGRDRRYAQTVTYISDGFSKIHQLNRDGGFDLRATREHLIYLCNNIASAYTLITGTKCNTSIKILGSEKNDEGIEALKAVTLCRSQDAFRNPKNNQVKHWLDENTDFLEIFNKIDNPSGFYFFSNVLPYRPGYQNTSVRVYKDDPEQNPILRTWRWPLPYKSTIVMPICPCEDQTSKTLIGFLCIDSPSIGAFKKDYDVALLDGIADGIYNPIRWLVDEIERDDSGDDQTQAR